MIASFGGNGLEFRQGLQHWILSLISAASQSAVSFANHPPTRPVPYPKSKINIDHYDSEIIIKPQV